MKIRIRTACALVISLMVSGSAIADEKNKDKKDDRFESFSTKLSGFNEVHFVAGPPAALRGAVSSPATGSFTAVLDKNANQIHYELNYEGLEGTVTQAHIHFGQRHTVGGIVIWLCQTAGTPAPSPVDPISITPLCPASGTVTGVITPGQVLAQTAQGIAAGEFDEVVRALRAGVTYANVHSSLFTPGEIRGQVRSGRKDD